MSDQDAMVQDPLLMGQEWKLPDRGSVGIIFLIVTETSLFAIFVAAYLVYIGASLNGPYPKDELEIPVGSTICLLSSSLTVYFADHALLHNQVGRFKLWLFATIVLGLEFLISTGLEWRKLIYEDHLTISTNLFGSTYYSLVGLRPSHGIVGLCFLILTMLVTLFGFPIQTQIRRIKFLSWYWHFVDGIWIVVF